MAENWAITIGINGYRYMPHLKYAKRDAEAMRGFFDHELGFHHVYHFAEDAPPIPQDYGPPLDAQPTFTTLRRFFLERFEDKKEFLKEGDNLWFFFAGHGIRFRERDYLMPYDGNRNDLQHSALELNFVVERLRRCGADNVILLIDACRNFEGRRDAFGGIGREKHQGVITLFSCSPDQASYEIDELQQGAFTHVLLNSLRETGEGNCATLERLYDRLRANVPPLTWEYKQDYQTPYCMVEPPSKNRLILLPKQATLTDVLALKNEAYEAADRGDRKTARQLWIRVLTVSPGDSQAIAAIERLARGASPPAEPPPSPPSPNAPSTGGGRSRAAAAGNPFQLPPPVRQSLGQRPVNQPSGTAFNPLRSSVPSTASSLPDSSATRMNRRQVVQLLGFTGGGIGALMLGYAISNRPTPSNSSNSKYWEVPELEPAITQGTVTEFNVATVNVEDKSIQVKRQRAEFRSQALDNDISLDLMAIPAGAFRMGSPAGIGDDDERPQHEVKVDAFWMGKYAVTQAQWRAVAAMPKVAIDLNPEPSRFEGNNRPVERVSWDEAVEFCQRLSQHSGRTYRLPSEAEWEYACRAGTTTPFHTGETLTPELANYNGNYTYGDGPKGEYREATTEVGSFPANAFGLYDMHGNAWEWCADHWHDSYKGAPADGSAWLSSDENALRLVRGGSWNHDPDNCRSADRDRGARDLDLNILGFRIACASSWTL